MAHNTIPKKSSDVIDPTSKTNGNSDLENETRSPFRSLSPIDNADQSGNYCNALLWALDNRENNDIKNIALTGPYGSGKSSILRTFVSKAKKQRKDLHFLHISLATFKEDYETTASEEKFDPSSEDSKHKALQEVQLLRQIEYSILQQIFYHVRHNDIPHTRFRKQRSLSEEQARKWTSGIFLFLVALTFEVYHKQFWSILGITPHRVLQIYYHGIAWLFLGICTYNFIRQTINSLHTLRLRKFNIKNAEFGVENNFEKSILNEYLDEILYFFDATQYNVVIIEDLDRFNKPEIFTKLREINQLINNKADRKTVVSFIYAVRDDMFMDRNRTKFFDFIIPVIPVVAPTNSNEILRRLINENEYPIDTDLIDGIASYVDDMRLLFNIMNEFYIYRQSLNENLNQNKLLALILYKNTYPKDFVALSNREGILYAAITQKETILQDETQQFDERIQNLKERRSEVLASAIKSAHDLRKLYLLEILTWEEVIIGFDHQGTDITYNDILLDKNFLLLVKGMMKAVVQLPDDGGYKAKPLDFKEIEKGVDSEETFAEKLDTLTHQQKLQLSDIEQRIQAVEKEKLTLRGNSIKNLMEQNLIDLKAMEHKQEQLVSILLRSGYIDEYFESYISIFYPESISRSDADFLLNVQAKLRTDFDYQLTHVAALASKLKDVEFEREFVLNYHLVDYLLQKKSSQTMREKFFTMLGNESSLSLQFINGYIKRGKKIDQFVAALVQKWEGIWNFYSLAERGHDYDFPEDFRTLIIKYGNVSDLVKIAKRSEIKSYIENRADFLNISVRGRKMEELISELNIKFKDIDMVECPMHLLNYVFSWNFYELNETMIRKWYILHDGLEINSLYSRHYSILKDSLEIDPLVDYIDDNLRIYIENVWLKLEQNQMEDDIYFEEFLESDMLPKDHKLKIIQKCDAKVSDVGPIEDLDIIKSLLLSGKVTATWLNLLRYYNRNDQQFDRFITGFLNMDFNAIELQIETLDGKNEIEHNVVHNFGQALILSNNIEDMHYTDLLQSIPWNYNSGLDFSSLSERKAQSLIQKLETTAENYEIMKRSFPRLTVELVEADVDSFIEEIGQYHLDGGDIQNIIQSEQLTTEQKSEIIGAVNELMVLNDFKLLQEIAKQCFIHKNISLPHRIMKTIVRDQDISLEHRINLSYILFESIPSYEVKEILSRWEEPYKKFGASFQELNFKPDEVDYKFLKSLVSIGVIGELKATKTQIRASK